MSEAASILDLLGRALKDGGVQVVDLTLPLGAETPVIPLPAQWGNTAPFRLEEISRYDERGPHWYWNNFHTGEHTGTHFDAPVHWVTGRDLPHNTTDTIPPQHFVAPACVIDVTALAEDDPDFLLERRHVEAWEAEHGRIEAGSWVLMRTGWSRRRDPERYLNVGEDGAHSPGPHPELLPFLIEERDVLGFGAETVGTDAGQAFGFEPPFPCHTLMHGAGRYGLPGLTNLDRLPPKGAIVIAAPLKIVGGSGSPVRALALVPA